MLCLTYYTNKCFKKAKKNKHIQTMIVEARQKGKNLIPTNGTLKFCDAEKFSKAQKRKTPNFLLLQQAIKDERISVVFFGNKLVEKGTDKYKMLCLQRQAAVNRHRGN